MKSVLHDRCVWLKLGICSISIQFITRGVHRTHTPRGTSTGYSAAIIDVTISADAHRTGAIAYILLLYSFMAISKECESDHLTVYTTTCIL